MRLKLPFRPFVAGLLALVATAMAGDDRKEVLIHQGPEFTTPGLGSTEEIRYIKEFPVKEAAWAAQPQLFMASGKLPLTAAKAAELALTQVESESGTGIPIVTGLELLRHGRAAGERLQPGVYYYLIALDVKGSEVHRVVLMDGRVVKSRLRQVKG